MCFSVPCIDGKGISTMVDNIKKEKDMLWPFIILAQSVLRGGDGTNIS